MEKTILIKEKYLIYEFNDQGNPKKWIYLPKFLKGIVITAATIIFIIATVMIWKYAEQNLITTYENYFGF